MIALVNSPRVLLMILAFIAGYWLVSRLFDLLRPARSRPGARAGAGGGPDPRRTRTGGASSAPRPDSSSDLDRHARTLELRFPASPADIKRAYREQLLKYHPDKVAHLGSELQQVAATRTRQILEAYDFFRRSGRCD